MMQSFGVWLILVVIISESVTQEDSEKCRKKFNVIKYTLNDGYVDQPLFTTVLKKTPQNLRVDNVCYTIFKLPDDPFTYQIFLSRVYCDGSNEVVSLIGTALENGMSNFTTRSCAFSTTVFGCDGCGTFFLYNCFEYGDCRSVSGTMVQGFSNKCRRTPLSCLSKVDAVLSDNNFSPDEYFVLPMKLRPRCVTQPACLNPRNTFRNPILGSRRI